jgi:hypothetical protein
MAHKSAEAAVQDLKRQQELAGAGYAALIVWRRDHERWSADLLAAVDQARYDVCSPFEKQTKNQYVIARKKKPTE